MPFSAIALTLVLLVDNAAKNAVLHGKMICVDPEHRYNCSNSRCSLPICIPCRWCGAQSRSLIPTGSTKSNGTDSAVSPASRTVAAGSSRNGNVFSSFSEVCEMLPTELNAESAVLDGELVVLDHNGRSVFNDLLFRRGQRRFYAFDLLFCDGQDLRLDGLLDRKRKLRSLIRKSEQLLFCDHIEERGDDLFRQACELNLEGIVAKRKNSPYIPKDPECHCLPQARRY